MSCSTGCPSWCNGTCCETRPKVAHYNYTRVQPWDVIDAWGLDFYLGNVVKYVARHQRKGAPMEDLVKARDYLNAAIARLEATER